MVAAYYSMTRDQDADAVRTYGSSHGSYGLGLADVSRYILITLCRSVRNVEQSVPYIFLKISTRQS